MKLRPDHSGNSAFTLVELMIVIVIIAIMSSIMVAEMGGTYEDALLRSNARKLIDVCDAASNRAIAVHQSQILRIDPATGRFVVRAKVETADDPDNGTTEGEFDARIALLIRQPQHNLESEEETAPRAEADTITFYPDGSAEAREFVFRDRAGVEILLRINPATSRVRIVEMAAQ